MDRRKFTNEQMSILESIGPLELARMCRCTDDSKGCPMAHLEEYHRCPFFFTGCCEITYNHWDAILYPKKKEKRNAHKNQSV